MFSMSTSTQEVDNFNANVDKILILAKQYELFLFSFYEILWKKSCSADTAFLAAGLTPYYI